MEKLGKKYYLTKLTGYKIINKGEPYEMSVPIEKMVQLCFASSEENAREAVWEAG